MIKQLTICGSRMKCFHFYFLCRYFLFYFAGCYAAFHISLVIDLSYLRMIRPETTAAGLVRLRWIMSRTEYHQPCPWAKSGASTEGRRRGYWVGDNPQLIHQRESERREDCGRCKAIGHRKTRLRRGAETWASRAGERIEIFYLGSCSKIYMFWKAKLAF
jgi:hypothetical protein